MSAWLYGEFGLWILAGLVGLAAVIASRISLHRAVTVLGWSSFGCFVVGALFWMFDDTYKYYLTQKKEYLRISYRGSVQEDKIMKQILVKFKKRYPEIPVKCEYYPGGYEYKIQQLLWAQEAPDVMQFQDEFLPRFAQGGKFEILDDYCRIPGLEVNLERDFWDTAVAYHKYKGKTYGIPLQGGVCLIIYNRDLFRQANIPEPHDNWTIDEFLETCKKLTVDSDGDGRIDQYGFLTPNWVYFLPFHYAFGATYLDPTRTTWTLWGPEAQASYQFWQDLRHRYHVAPNRNQLREVSDHSSFLTGRVAMFIGLPGNMQLLDEAGMNYGVAPAPIGPAGRATRVTWDSFVMSSGSKKKDWAWKFIQFVTSKPAQDIIARNKSSLPALKASSETFIQVNEEIIGRRWIEALGYSRIQPVSLHWQLMSRELHSETEKMMDNRQSPIETLRRLAANRDLSKCFIMPDLQAEAAQR